jgi:hypothetical protein
MNEKINLNITQKFYSYVTEKMHEIYKIQQTTNVRQDMQCHYSCTEDDIKEQNVQWPRSIGVSGKVSAGKWETGNNYLNFRRMQMNCTMNYINKAP